MRWKMNEDINFLIHTNAANAFRQGRIAEQNRIIKLLTPLATHDEEMCYNDGKQECWPDDCSAPLYQYAIDIIKGEHK